MAKIDPRHMMFCMLCNSDELEYVYSDEKETPGIRTKKKRRVTYKDSSKGYNVI